MGSSYIIYLIPISVATLGINQIVDAYSTRGELYREIASSKVITSSTSSISQISTRYLFNIDWLIIGKIFGDLLGTLSLVRGLGGKIYRLKSVTWGDIVSNMSRYREFPKFQMPSNLLNSLSQNIPLFMLSLLFSPAVAGLYSLTYRAMQTPTLLISSATRSVFYQRASKIYSEGGDIFPLYISTTVGLLKLFAIPFVVIVLFGQDIFSNIFGEEWREAGLIAEISVVWFYFGFISPPTTMTFNILNLQKVRLYIQIATLISRQLQST